MTKHRLNRLIAHARELPEEPPCYEPHSGLRHEVAAEIDRIGRSARIHFLTTEIERVTEEINVNSRTHGSSESDRAGIELADELARLGAELEKLKEMG